MDKEKTVKYEIPLHLVHILDEEGIGHSPANQDEFTQALTERATVLKRIEIEEVISARLVHLRGMYLGLPEREHCNYVILATANGHSTIAAEPSLKAAQEQFSRIVATAIKMHAFGEATETRH